MKQKKINDILYVFDITPYVITQDTDADVIKVQEECYAGYVELNPTLADKIVKYNYHMITVTQQEWAPYVDQDDKQSPELAWSSNTATVTIGSSGNTYPTLSNPHSVTVTYNSTDTAVATIDENGDITLLTEGETSIWAIFDGDDTYEAQIVTYELTVQQAQPVPQGNTLTLDGQNIHANITVEFDGVEQQTEYQYQDVAENTVIDIWPTDEDPSHYELISGATWDTDHCTATMCDTDLTITINYEVIPVTPTYAITFASGDEQYIAAVKVGGEANTEGTNDYNPTEVPDQEAGTYIKLFPDNNDPTGITIDTPNVTFVDAATSFNGMPFWYFVMPAESVEISITYTAPQPTADKFFVVPKIDGSYPLEFGIYDTVEEDFIESLTYYSCTDMGDHYDVMLIGERAYEKYPILTGTDYSVELYYDDQYTNPVQTTTGQAGMEFEFASSDTAMYAKLTPIQQPL